MIVVPYRRGAWTATASTGGTAARLVDGLLSSMWRSALSSATHTITLSSILPRVVHLVALHDVRAAAAVMAVKVTVSTPVVYPSPIERNSAVFLGNSATVNSVTIEITLAAPSILSVGQVVAGEGVEIPVRELTRREDHVVVANGEYKTVVRHPRMALDLALPPALSDSFASLIESLRGVDPVTLIPDEQGKVALFGSLGTAHASTFDVNRIYQRAPLQFVESQRALV